MKIKIAILLILLLFSLIAAAQTGKVTVEYFYDPGCQKCARASPVIDSLVGYYGDGVVFSKYNILTDEGLAEGKKYALTGIPALVINKQRVISYADYEGNTTKLEELLPTSIA